MAVSRINNSSNCSCLSCFWRAKWAHCSAATACSAWTVVKRSCAWALKVSIWLASCSTCFISASKRSFVAVKLACCSVNVAFFVWYSVKNWCNSRDSYSNKRFSFVKRVIVSVWLANLLSISCCFKRFCSPAERNISARSVAVFTSCESAWTSCSTLLSCVSNWVICSVIVWSSCACENRLPWLPRLLAPPVIEPPGFITSPSNETTRYW